MIGRRGRRVATHASTGSDASTANAGPNDENVRLAESSRRSPRSASTAPGPSPTASVTWLDPPSAASIPTSATPATTTAAPARTTRRASRRVPSRRRASVAYAASRTRRPPPSAPNRLPATATSASARDGDPQASEQRRAEQRGEEQERLEQVRDAVEAPRLGRPERRERHGLRVEAERQEIRAEDRSAGDAERQQGRRQADERDGPPADEPEVRGEREEDHPGREARGEERREVGDPTDEDAQRKPDPVVALDPLLKPLERRDGVVRLDDLELSARDVREGDEAVDPRRVGREQPARPRRHGDRVAIVLAAARAEGGRRACPAAGLPRARAAASEAGVPPSSELCTSPVSRVLSALSRVTVGPAPGTASPTAPEPA